MLRVNALVAWNVSLATTDYGGPGSAPGALRWKTRATVGAPLWDGNAIYSYHVYYGPRGNDLFAPIVVVDDVVYVSRRDKR